MRLNSVAEPQEIPPRPICRWRPAGSGGARARRLALLWCAVIGISCSGGGASDTNQAPPRFVPTSQYATTNIGGWTVRVNRELLAVQRELGSNALHLLALKLADITNTVPARARAELQKIPIWLGVNDGHAPCAEYHPSRQWLDRHGYNPDKARSVEIGHARRFVEWSRTQPSMVLHELAHAYHHQVLGHDHERIKAAFAAAQAAGNYDSVRHVGGRRQRAYALNNVQEFFAEATEAFFGTNDFYPFTRAELKEHDPLTFSVLEEVWNR